jgi:ABC-2 type transport system ATP-binding protein
VGAPAIEVDGLWRRFGRGTDRVVALADVSFAVEPGSIVALLGANGAGKTTMTKVLATLLVPSEGAARLFGHDVVRDAGACRRLASVVFGGERGLYPELSGDDNLRFFGMLAGVRRSEMRARVPQLLEQVGLAEVAHRRVETYSKGMKQRLHIAIGFLPRPRLLLLDEPTVGLDPMEAQRLRDTIAQARRDGVTALLTSHYLLDVEQLADRVLLLDRGRIKEDLPLAEFVSRAGYTAAVTIRGDGPTPAAPVGTSAGISVLEPPRPTPDGWEVTVRVERWSPQVFTELAGLFEGTRVVDVEVRQVRLEDAFSVVVGGHG